MEIAELLTTTFDSIAGLVPSAVEDLSFDQLAHRPDGTGNSVAWLVWHLSRVQDDHLADAAGTEQLWAQGWRERFGLDFSASGADPDGVGYGHSSADVAAVRAEADLLTGYHAAVAEATTDFLGELGASDLDRIVDRRFDPPVTLGVRLVSVIGDCLQHVGQAAYVRGLILG